MAYRGAYNETTWNSGAAPGISAAELQRIEAQIKVLDDAWITDNTLDIGTQLYLNATSAADIRPGGDVTPFLDGGGNLGSAALWWMSLYVNDIHYALLVLNSDERDKPYMAPVDVPIAALRALRPIRFQRDGDDERVSLGFGAQTLDVWVADWLGAGDYSMVTEPTPDTDERWGMDATQLIPPMVGWMQELLGRVEALEAG